MLRMTRMTSRAHFPSSRSPEPRTMTSSRRLAALLALAGAIASPRGARAEGRPIQDNSFLIEEAYNQEAGVIQHINTFARTRGGAWGSSFPEGGRVLGQPHQASATFPAAAPEGAWAGVGPPELNS